MMRFILLFSLPLLAMGGCAKPQVWQPAHRGTPPAYSLFNITLHCDDAYEQATENAVPTVEEMVERELAGTPYIPGSAIAEPPGWGVPFDSCDALLESMRTGSSELLPTVKYGRAQSF